jgi:hypothetical protein
MTLGAAVADQQHIAFLRGRQVAFVTEEIVGLTDRAHDEDARAVVVAPSER